MPEIDCIKEVQPNLISGGSRDLGWCWSREEEGRLVTSNPGANPSATFCCCLNTAEAGGTGIELARVDRLEIDQDAP